VNVEDLNISTIAQEPECESGRAPSPLEGRRERARVSGGPIRVSEGDIERIHALYVSGLNLRAWEICQRIGPLRDWVGADARIMAGRLAANLGGMRLGQWFHLLAFRDEPNHANANYYFARRLMDRRGPYAAWQFIKARNDVVEGAKDAPVTVRADWLALGASTAATFRDFGTAEALMARAEKMSPERAWLHVERSFIFGQQDRHEEALASARRALELSACYRPAVQQAAHILMHLNRDEEAVALLRDAAARTESAPIVAQLAAILSEANKHEEARALWERVAELSPLADRDYVRFLAARRSDAAYDCGDYAAAAALAKEASAGKAWKGTFHAQIAERLSQDPTGKRRVELSVGFVQQHHMTCAPATLSALSGYWGRPAEHLGIVEAICYDGTPAHSERAWAESQGYVCREFRVTWDAAVALIDSGVPFTLATVEVTSAHLQAVIGYDARRHTLLIRDPTWKYTGEGLADGMEERYKSTGPRGMAMVPSERRELLEGLELPEAGLYDRFNELQRALVGHRREEAAAAYAAMGAEAPGHRLTLWAKRSLATYDADPLAQLAAIDELIKLFPDDQMLQLQRLGYLRHLARRADLLETLGRMCQNPKNDPVFRQQYAQELAADARELPRAMKLLGKCLRYRPTDPLNYFYLAGMLWDRRRFEDALELYRFAACLNDKDDYLASTYFNAARFFKKAEEALGLLRDRFKRFAGRSAGPTRTLFQALASVDRTPEAFEVVEEGLRRRPTDAEVSLHAADAYARYANFGRAAELLTASKANAHPAQYRRARAALANYKGELASALEQWQKVLESEPLALDAHETVARLLAETRGREAAIAHLREATARFEHHYPLFQVYLQWLRNEDQAQYEGVVRRLLESRPADAWLVRELALSLLRQARVEEAAAAAAESLRLEPEHTSSHSVAARVYAVAGRVEDAKRHARRALELSIDNEGAMAELIDLCATPDERREALRFFCDQLVKQVTSGDGLLAYRQVASGTLDNEETLRTLDEALAARPDLWHAWSAKARQLADMSRFDEAVEVLRQATQRFPLLPRIWLDLAAVQAVRGDRAGEAESLTKALQIAPGWGPAVRQLANARAREGNFAEAKRLLEGAIAWAPLDPLNYGEIAEIEWKLGERESAAERLRKTLNLAPTYDWAWGMLKQWGAELKRPGLAAELARELTVKRAGEGKSWFLLARTIEGEGPDVLAQRLAAIDHALKLEPLEVDYHDFRAVVLAHTGRWDEALGACSPVAFASSPVRLRGRAAWLTAMRGDLEGAIEQMRRVVMDDPRYVWGWTMLAQWHREQNQNEGYAQSARQLAVLAPLDATSWGYLGDALERQRDLAGAAASYRRAFELDPQYTFGAYGAFDTQLQAGDLAGARATLALIARHAPGSLTSARRVQLLAAERDQPGAVEALKELCQLEEVHGGAAKLALDAINHAGWRGAAERVLELALGQPTVSPTIAEEWVRRKGQAGAWRDVEKMLDKLRAAGPDPQTDLDGRSCRPATFAYMEALCAAKQEGRLLRFAKRNRERLAHDNLYWGVLGGSLTSLRLHKRAVKWMADWEQRLAAEGGDPARRGGPVEQWMLANLNNGLRSLGRHDEAARVTERALGLKGDSMEVTLRLWRAVDRAAAGRFDDVAGVLERYARDSLSDYQRFLRDLAGAAAAQEKAGFAGARRALARLVAGAPGFVRNKALLGAYRMAIRAIGGRGGWAGRIWRVLKYLGTVNVGH
jgi:predicted Zn-dependent protease